MSQRILVTGDYWHHDFQAFLQGLDHVTLIPIESVAKHTGEACDLIVVIQARREQFPLETIESIQNQFANTPIVALLGSWCEGEVRSGNVWPGVIRIYWHQWQGRLESFLQQMEKNAISNWHTSPTATPADRIQQPTTVPAAHFKIQYVGISAWTRSEYDVLHEAMESFGWQSRWVERSIWDAESQQALNPVCIQADSVTSDLERRLKWLKREFPQASFVVILNFPRSNEVDRLSELGVSRVVSQPFELNDLKTAIVHATRNRPTVKTITDQPESKS